MSVSLLIAYRNREVHLNELIAYFKNINFQHEIEIILIEGNKTSSLTELTRLTGILPYMKVIHVPMEGTFHKSLLLNTGLKNANHEYIIPYDIDLLPLNHAIDRSLNIAKSCPKILVSGYRLMSDTPYYKGNPNELGFAPEDSNSAIKKQIVNGERFGVCPVFERNRLLDIGGWDERFIGWGAEDQDIIERYCDNNIEMARFTSIAYAHLHHDHADGWNETDLIKKNRQLYSEKRTNKINASHS
jgi:glycosyltransferase involved in cell wall biosynthesis